jgi:hypothetical protein
VNNLDYPFYLVGRHITFPVITKRNIPWVEFVFPILRIGRLEPDKKIRKHLLISFYNLTPFDVTNVLHTSSECRSAAEAARLLTLHSQAYCGTIKWLHEPLTHTVSFKSAACLLTKCEFFLQFVKFLCFSVLKLACVSSVREVLVSTRKRSRCLHPTIQ